jgi:proline iminopeptidase
VKGEKVYYQIEGTGIPCLILSYVDTLPYQRLFSENLRKNLQLIFLDLGGGHSDPRNIDEMTLDSIMVDIDGFRRELNLDRIAMVGHSAHLLLTLEYARRYPQNLSHIILMGLGPKWWQLDDYRKIQDDYWDEFASDERKEKYSKNMKELTEARLSSVSPDEAYILWYVAMAPKLWYDYDFDCSHLWEGAIFNREVMDRLFEVVLKDYDATPYLSEIECPVFLAVGRYDFVGPPPLWDGEKEKLQNCTHYLFERSGHNPQLEEQALFDEKLIDWIKKEY